MPLSKPAGFRLLTLAALLLQNGAEQWVKGQIGRSAFRLETVDLDREVSSLGTHILTLFCLLQFLQFLVIIIIILILSSCPANHP